MIIIIDIPIAISKHYACAQENIYIFNVYNPLRMLNPTTDALFHQIKLRNVTNVPPLYRNS